MMERLRGSWRSRRKKIKSKSRKNRASKERDDEGAAPSTTKSKIPNLRKVDSNATEVRSNTTKAVLQKMADEEREGEAETEQSLPSIRERSGTPNTEATASHEENEAAAAEVPVPSIEENFSVEVGDEVNHVEVGVVRSPSSEKAGKDALATAGEAAALKKDPSKDMVEETSRALVPAKSAQAPVVGPKDDPVVVEDVDETESCADKQVALIDAPKDSKWAKKVSISIAGYKTSFQFSDPMSNLAQKVNEALDVVGSDAALVDQAKGLDDIGDNKVDEERDYDENPTKLFMYLQQRAWGLAMERLKKNPEEAKVWVYRKQILKSGENLKNASTSQALTVQSQALVPHEGGDSSNKLRWKLLPLHASIVLGAPSEIIMDIIKVYPNAARKPDERGSLPVHLAASRLDVDPEGEKVVLHLFGAYPDSIQMQDRKGRTPQELAKLARMRKEAEEQRRLNASQEIPEIEKTASSFHHDLEGEESDAPSEAEGKEEQEQDDDCSVKSGISARFKMMLKKSKSTDTHDRRRKKGKKKKSASSSSSVRSLSRARSADGTEPDEMGPGFAILKPTKEYEARVKSENANPKSLLDDEEEGTAANKDAIASFYTTPLQAPPSTDVARSIPLPKSFSICEDEASVKSSASARSTGSKASVKSTGSKSSVRSAGSKSSVRSIGSQSKASKAATVDAPLPPVAEKEPETTCSEPAVTEAVSDKAEDVTEAPQVEQHNESLLLLLEKAAENVGRSAEDVMEFLKDLEDEWVTDVEALRRLDGETLDAILPIVLSREVQRLMSHADTIDNKFLTEDKENGKWVRSDKERSVSRNTRKQARRAARKSKKISSKSGVPQDASSLNAIREEDASDDDVQTVYSIRTEAPAAPVQSHANSTVRIHEAPTEVKEYKSEEPSEVD
ncbi:hypothetical protein ACHAWX_004198, partial [Stephanocyclus meneghinianus]